jgi:hypothetical protein
MVSQLFCFAKNCTILGLMTCLCFFPFEECYGGRASNSLGSTFVINNNPPPAELQRDSIIAGFITTLAIFRSYETVNNWYGAQTNNTNMYAAANASGQQYGIAFYIGHGNQTTGWNGTHWSIQASISGSPVWDRWILFAQHPNWPPDPPNPPTNHPLKFAFIWSCFQGRVRGGTYNDPYWGKVYYGMPYGWLRTANLSGDGYDFPDGTNSTFIGWYEEAPWLIDRISDNGVNAENASYYFLLNFYVSALYNQKTICQSLDDASAAVWGLSYFAWTKFRNGFWYTEPGTNQTAWLAMVVYGDGGQRLR